MKKILVVDNHPVMLEFMTRLLVREGYQVLQANDGLSALDTMKYWVPDVIFIDLVMHNIGGQKLCQIINRTPKLKDIYIVIISAVAVEEDIDVNDFGANTCIAKGPFNEMSRHIIEVLDQLDQRSSTVSSRGIIGRENVYAREITKELLSAKSHFEVILGSMSEGIMEITSEARIVYANPAAIAIIGKPEERLLTSGLMDLFSGTAKQRVKDILTALPKGPQRISDDAPLRLKGKQLTIDLLPLQNEDNKALVMLKDVTDRKRMEAQLLQSMEHAKQMAVEANAANAAKSSFLATMSHEIRTPMNAVIGFTDMLLETEISEEQISFAKTIKQGGEMLLSLINDILDFSKVEAGQLSLESIDFDPEMTVFSICDLIRPQVAEKPIKILCRIGDEVPGYINGDPGRFRQVLLNLMGNAAKFTDSGEIELYLDIDKENKDRVKLHTRVRDTGTAIPKDKLETIFEAFEQADGSTTRRYGGTGLGLSICRRIAMLMGGDVWAESQPEKGNTFHFTASLGKSRAKPDRKPFQISLSGKKVLIVDDNQTNLDILTHMLEPEGIRVVHLMDGEEVLPEIKRALKEKDPFDLCMLDIEIQGMSGYAVAKSIRKQKAVSYLSILAFAFPTGKRAQKCLEAGFDGFLPTPIQREKLLEMIERLMQDKSEVGAKKKKGKGGRIVTQYSIREEKKHSVSILLAEDNPASQRLARLMLTKSGYQVETADNGKEAVEKYIKDPIRFDLIFLDIQMPEMDGYAAARAIRKWERGNEDKEKEGARARRRGARPNRIPIVAVTASAMAGDREKCFKAGMDDYMPKPIKREIVFEILDRWILR